MEQVTQRLLLSGYPSSISQSDDLFHGESAVCLLRRGHQASHAYISYCSLISPPPQQDQTSIKGRIYYTDIDWHHDGCYEWAPTLGCCFISLFTRPFPLSFQTTINISTVPSDARGETKDPDLGLFGPLSLHPPLRLTDLGIIRTFRCYTPSASAVRIRSG